MSKDSMSSILSKDLLRYLEISKEAEAKKHKYAEKLAADGGISNDQIVQFDAFAASAKSSIDDKFRITWTAVDLLGKDKVEEVYSLLEDTDHD